MFISSLILAVVKSSSFSCRVTPQLKAHAERHVFKEAASNACKKTIALSDSHVVQRLCHEELIHRQLCSLTSLHRVPDPCGSSVYFQKFGFATRVVVKDKHELQIRFIHGFN